MKRYLIPSTAFVTQFQPSVGIKLYISAHLKSATSCGLDRKPAWIQPRTSLRKCQNEANLKGAKATICWRKRHLVKHLKDLKQLADVNNALVLVTNQVHSKPDAMWGDPTKPIGGHVLAHASTFRLYLRKAKAGRRIARLVDSPNLPDGECVYQVTQEGLRD